MIRNLLEMLGFGAASDETLIWEADPLVIVGDEVEIRYPGRTNIEFTPTDAIGLKGLAVAETTAEGWIPKLHVQDRINYPVSIDVHIRSRGGFTLIGEDDDGRPFTWYLGKAADDYLRNLRPEHESSKAGT